MKKQYINPEMEIVKIETQQLIATSNVGLGGTISDPTQAEGRFDDFDE